MLFHSRLRFLRQFCVVRTVNRCRKQRLRLECLDDRTVPSNFTAANVPELIADINAANVSAGADTITLVAGSRFTLTSVNNTTHGPTGLPVIAAGEDLTIGGNGDIIERRTAGGTPAFRLFDVGAGATLTLQNVTLQGGVAKGDGGSPLDGGPSQGGAIYNQGSLTLTGVTVQNNTARGSDLFSFGIGYYPATNAQGGGVYSSGSLTLTGCTIRSNVATAGIGYNGEFGGADAAGGGLYSVGSLTIAGCTIENNVAAAGRGPAGGGGGYAGGQPGGNSVGGGLCVVGGTATISNSTFYSNTAQGGDGGNAGYFYDTFNGVKVGGPGGSGGNAFGGGLYVSGATVTVHTVSLISNRATGGAGGQGTRGEAGGMAGQGIGGGIYVDSSALVGLDAFTASHLTRNRASTLDPDIHGSFFVI